MGKKYFLELGSFGYISGTVHVIFHKKKKSTNAVNYTGNPVSWYITVILKVKVDKMD